MSYSTEIKAINHFGVEAGKTLKREEIKRIGVSNQLTQPQLVKFSNIHQTNKMFKEWGIPFFNYRKNFAFQDIQVIFRQLCVRSLDFHHLLIQGFPIVKMKLQTSILLHNLTIHPNLFCVIKEISSKVGKYASQGVYRSHIGCLK